MYTKQGGVGGTVSQLKQFYTGEKVGVILTLGGENYCFRTFFCLSTMRFMCMVQSVVTYVQKYRVLIDTTF